MSIEQEIEGGWQKLPPAAKYGGLALFAVAGLVVLMRKKKSTPGNLTPDNGPVYNVQFPGGSGGGDIVNNGGGGGGGGGGGSGGDGHMGPTRPLYQDPHPPAVMGPTRPLYQAPHPPTVSQPTPWQGNYFDPFGSSVMALRDGGTYSGALMLPVSRTGLLPSPMGAGGIMGTNPRPAFQQYDAGGIRPGANSDPAIHP